MAISRNLTMDEIDDDAWDGAKRQIVEWMTAQIATMKSANQYDAAAQAITRVGLKTLAVKNGTSVAEPEADYHIDASDVDIDRLFEEAGRVLSHGLHMTYWQANADRDALDAKVEVIVLARHHSAMSAMESAAEKAFDTLYDTHKKAIAKLKEQRRNHYERLRLATAKPTECLGTCLNQSTSGACQLIRNGNAISMWRVMGNSVLNSGPGSREC